jgi:hypothetical protein
VVEVEVEVAADGLERVSISGSAGKISKKRYNNNNNK